VRRLAARKLRRTLEGRLRWKWEELKEASKWLETASAVGGARKPAPVVARALRRAVARVAGPAAG
jgi:hypothetical protein